MRTSRWILSTAAATMFALLYVFQQTEIMKVGYKITEAQKILEASLDRKTALEYTLSTLESPLNFDKNLFLQSNQFELAGGYKLVRLAPAPGAAAKNVAASGVRASGGPTKRLALRSLFAARQAEAKTIK